MRIVYVLESLELSGGVKVIVEHAEGLRARGHDVMLVTRDARSPSACSTTTFTPPDSSRDSTT